MSNSFPDQKVHTINFNYVNGFLIYNDESAVLVDSGRKNTTDQFSEALKELNIEPSRVKLIILTHTHFDHAGGAAAIKKITGARVAVHQNEADNLRKGFTPFPRGTRWKGKFIVFIGRIFTRQLAHYEPLNPDIVLENEFDLNDYGIDGKVLHTPGHTSGSVTVFLGKKHAFVGDNLMGISEKEYFPPFANDRSGVVKAWEKYIESGVSNLYPAHGKPVSSIAIADSIQMVKKRYLNFSE